MDRRYLAALLISAVVLLLYPRYLEWIGLTHPQKISRESALPVEKTTPRVEKKPARLGQILPYKNQLYEILFTTQGASVASLKLGDTLFYQAKPGEDGTFVATLRDESEDLTREIFQSRPSEGRGLPPHFAFEKPGEYRITKRFFVGSEKPTLVVEAELENLSGRQRNFSLGFQYGLDLDLHSSRDEGSVKMARYAGTEVSLTNLAAIRRKPPPTAGPLDWHGLMRKYDAVLVKPDLKLTGQETRFEEGRLTSDLRLEPLTLGPGEKKTVRFLVYAGPQRHEGLREFGLGFDKILSYGKLGALRVALLLALNFFHRLVGNYGAAILLLTLLIKLLFTPLTHLSYGSMKKMQALQPKIKALQKQYQKDTSRLNKEMMELYRRNRVNPMMGCLPMVLQIPIFVAFYQTLSNAVELKGAGFILWIHDLSEPDRLFSWQASLPLIGRSFNLLPLLMIGSMLWQQKLTPQTASTPEQEKMMYLMPAVFGFVFYSLPSGLVLYWLANNLLTIFHQLVIKRIPVILHHEDSE